MDIAFSFMMGATALNMIGCFKNARFLFKKSKAIDWHDKFLTEQITRVGELERELNLTKPCENDFLYVWYADARPELSEEIQAFLAAQEPSKFKVEIEDWRKLVGVDQIRISTTDKQFAMLFKLTFGGAA